MSTVSDASNHVKTPSGPIGSLDAFDKNGAAPSVTPVIDLMRPTHAVKLPRSLVPPTFPAAAGEQRSFDHSPFGAELSAVPAAESTRNETEAPPHRSGLPVLGRRDDMQKSPGPEHQPVQIVLDPRMLSPVAIPRAMLWTLRDIVQVLAVALLIALLGLGGGWQFGATRDVEQTARSEFIYFLEDALPDGFLREDRRILTQLVTIESENSLQPVADEFGTTVKDLRKQLEVDVVDLSEVIRLDIDDVDPDRALSINRAILDGYRSQAAENDRRADSSDAIARREAILVELAELDEAEFRFEEAELADVSLKVQEESLLRLIETATDRVDRLSSNADGLLSESEFIDDRGSLNAQVQSSKARLTQLEAELSDISSQRARLQRTIVTQLESEFPYNASDNQQRDARLSVSEDSIRREIETIAQRVVGLERALTDTLLDNEVRPSGTRVEQELVGARARVKELEQDLLIVRTQRSELAQNSAAGPSLLRRIERLEQDLSVLDSEIAESMATASRPSPVEVLTEPMVLAEPASNPKLRWAALGALASLPVAALAAAATRARQRRSR